MTLESRQKVEHSFDKPELLGSYTHIGLIDRALQIDSTLATAWLGLISVMVSAEVDIKPSGASQEVIDFVKEALFKRADRRFADFHTDLLNALLYGVAPFEVTLKYEDNHWWLRNLNFIHPRFFDWSSLKKEPGEWWVTGRCFVNGLPTPVGGPGSGLPVVWWPVYGRGILGSSLMRPVIATHVEKAEVQDERRIALQKSIQGSIVALSGEPTTLMEELTPEQLEDVATALANCAAGTDNAVALPPQIKQVMPIYPATDSISKSIEAEDHCDLSMLSAFGSLSSARGILTGYGSQGAAVGDSQAQQALRSYFFQWGARLFQNIIDWLIDVNFGAQKCYPELRIISSTPQTAESLVRAAVQLSAAGAIQYTEADEAFFRQLLRLPEKQGHVIEPTTQADDAKLTTGHYDTATGLDTRDLTARYEADADDKNNLA